MRNIKKNENNKNIDKQKQQEFSFCLGKWSRGILKDKFPPHKSIIYIMADHSIPLKA